MTHGSPNSIEIIMEADETQVKAEGIGTVHLNVIAKNEMKSNYLENTLFVPLLGGNLILISKISDEVVMKSNMTHIFNGPNIVMEAKKENWMFLKQTKKINQKCRKTSDSNVKAELWHQ
uniref:Retrovirus-related Pol polyprotein from transposon TNT 1-94-like beta-barrel domain-containing protein n=1 Tax=Glossina morsitans morsitans TaxID=37546 RepID=A0A1B0G9N6_GLOMM